MLLEEEKKFEDYFEDEGFNREEEPKLWNESRHRSETDGLIKNWIRPLIRFHENLSYIHLHEEM